jgi:hypothetical protein
LADKNNDMVSQEIYHVGYSSSFSDTDVKQHWAWIILGWDSLQGISGSVGTIAVV